MSGNITEKILGDIRYVNPSTDKNHTRWELNIIWSETLKAVKKDMMKYKSKEASRDAILEGIHAEKESIYHQQLIGLIISYGALMGVEVKELPELVKHLALDMKDELFGNFHKVQDKYDKAFKRFSLLS